jgi:hypothetical protein
MLMFLCSLSALIKLCLNLNFVYWNVISIYRKKTLPVLRPWIYFQITFQCTLIWPCVMQLTAARTKYHKHLLFHLCWPKYLKLTSCHVDDSNEFIVQVMFWAAGSPVSLDTNIQHHKRRAVRVRAYMRYFIAEHFFGWIHFNIDRSSVIGSPK